MPKKAEPKNCWEFLNCPKEIKEACLAYKKNLGRACWTVPYGLSGAPKKDFKMCKTCPWYRKLNP
jgi:hypothetical protein